MKQAGNKVSMKRQISIETYETPNGKIFVLNQPIGKLNEYEKAKAITKFINSETKVLETCVETYLRQILHENGVIPYDGSESALIKAFNELEFKNKKIEIVDRYANLANESIVGQSSNQMTIIIENEILSSAVEVIING